MRQLTPVPSRELPSRVRVEAIAALDLQRAADGLFLLPGGAVLLLELTSAGHWRARYWEPAPE